MLNIAERRYVPRKGQSIFPCRTGGTDTNLTKMTPYTKTDERRYNYTQNLPHSRRNTTKSSLLHHPLSINARAITTLPSTT